MGETARSSEISLGFFDELENDMAQASAATVTSAKPEGLVVKPSGPACMTTATQVRKIPSKLANSKNFGPVTCAIVSKKMAFPPVKSSFQTKAKTANTPTVRSIPAVHSSFQ